MKRSTCLPVALAAALVFASALAAPAPADEPAAAATPMYVDSQAIRDRFDTITEKDMELIRSKKLLFASRSFGLNLRGGLASLARGDAKYTLPMMEGRPYDVFGAKGDVSIIPADAFEKHNVVHFLATYWPHTKRVEEVEQLLTQPPHNFGQTADAVIIFFHTAAPQNFKQYATKMDALQKQFPKVRFIYVTAGFMDKEKQAKNNAAAHEWSELVRARYKGKRPLYDLGKILSDDFRCGHGYCPEYSKDPAGVHPNLDAGQTMMAKGFLLVLKEAFAAEYPLPELPPLAEGAEAPKEAPPAPAKEAAPAPAKEAAPAPAKEAPSAAGDKLAPGSADYKAVQAVLDAAGLKGRTVDGVSVVKNGRVVELYLQEGGVTTLPAAIGELSELRVLHVYGDRSLGHPLLKTIDPAIGRLVKLETLLVNENELETLPAEIVNLKNLKTLSLADNRLKDLPPAVRAWAEKLDPKGLQQQRP